MSGFARFLVDLESVTTPELVRRLSRDGLVAFTGVGDRNELLHLSRRLGEIRPHPHGDADDLTLIARRSELQGHSTDGFSSRRLALHTDGSSMARPPTLVIIGCLAPATDGGATVLADGAAAHRDLLRIAPAALAALSAPGSARFGASGGFESAVYTPVPGTDRVCVRFRSDADIWFAAETRRALPLFASVLRSRSFMLDLGPGDGYVLQNGRWLHGRRALSGSQSMLRALCDPSSPALAFGFRPRALSAAV